jgi:hypothetical protein
MLAPPTRHALKQRAYRRRYAIGLVAPNVAFNMGAVADLLVREGFLPPHQREHLPAVKAALETALQVWARYS